mmetsp:Transcript_53311/g.141287  ORF Transcript_53311/g.141287 Transcript_53311/m.141287 type:complete len:151 (-) Transcript_53311:1423-1875(-)
MLFMDWAAPGAALQLIIPHSSYNSGYSLRLTSPSPNASTIPQGLFWVSNSLSQMIKTSSLTPDMTLDVLCSPSGGNVLGCEDVAGEKRPHLAIIRQSVLPPWNVARTYPTDRCPFPRPLPLISPPLRPSRISFHLGIWNPPCPCKLASGF